MSQLLLNYKAVTIADLQKQIDTKIIQKFLKQAQLLDHVSRFSKKDDKIQLEFVNQQEAQKFIDRHNHKTQILARKFNVYYSFFDENTVSASLSRFQVNGITEQKLRNAYEICRNYGPSRFKLSYDHNKLVYNCRLEFLRFCQEKDFASLKWAFVGLEIKVRPEQSFGLPSQFRCSIELSNFFPIKAAEISQQDQEELIVRLRQLIQKVSQYQIYAVELHAYLHRQLPQVKAYFKFETKQLTLSEFQKLRKYFLNEPQIHTKLFYFQNDANSFYTLFTVGLINSKDLPDKQFEDVLLESFRKIQPNITQILVKKQYKAYTGKIYLGDQQSGKELLANYRNHRNKIYQFYKPNSIISIDMFKDKRQQKKQEKYVNNGQRIVKHLQNHDHKSRPFATQQQFPITPLHPFGPPYIYNSRPTHEQSGQRSQYYKRGQKRNNFVPKNQREENTRQQRQQPVKAYKEKVQFREDDFPSL